MHSSTNCIASVWTCTLVLQLLLLLPIIAQPRSDQNFRLLPAHGKRYRQAMAPVASDEGATDAPLPPICGQYGFRCIDDQSYQVCSLTDVNDQTDEPNAVHECAEDMLCDEDNNAYCSPRFRLVDIQPPTGRRCGLSNKRKRENAEAGGTQRPDAGNKTDFQCEAYGMFPDSTNHSMFWFCDRGCHEHTFNVRHMLCAQQLVFDADRNECIHPADSAQPSQPLASSNAASPIRPITRTNRQRIAELRAVQSAGMTFSCTGRPLGKYPDPSDCRRYHLCVPEKSDNQKSFNEVIFVCPEGTAYDSLAETCNAAAINRCVCDQSEEEDKDGDAVEDDDGQLDAANTATDGRCHCSTGSRTAATNRPDAYRLCVGQAMLLLSCPLGTQFNTTTLSCQPAAQ